MKLELILGDAKVRVTPPVVFFDAFALFNIRHPSVDKTWAMMFESINLISGKDLILLLRK